MREKKNKKQQIKDKRKHWKYTNKMWGEIINTIQYIKSELIDNIYDIYLIN